MWLVNKYINNRLQTLIDYKTRISDLSHWKKLLSGMLYLTVHLCGVKCQWQKGTCFEALCGLCFLPKICLCVLVQKPSNESHYLIYELWEKSSVWGSHLLTNYSKTFQKSDVDFLEIPELLSTMLASYGGSWPTAWYSWTFTLWFQVTNKCSYLKCELEILCSYWFTLYFCLMNLV